MKRLLQDPVAAHAAARPGATAVVMGGRRLTYGELATWSSRVAHGLVAAGCRKGDRVCFAIPKSIEAAVAILGILKADCIYVPLDLGSPAARVARILGSCRPAVVLGTAAGRKLLTQLGAQFPAVASGAIGWLDAGDAPVPGWRRGPCAGDIESMPASPPATRGAPEDPAYILFTSGSTGQPKGVVITHRNVLAFLDWAIPWFEISPSDRLSAHPPLHFDLSVFDLFGSLTAGAELHLVPAELNLLPHRMAGFIRESELTQWFSVPSVLRGMAKLGAVRQDDFPRMKRLLWCGEVFPTPSLIHWMDRLPHVRFTNLYGPTEATIASSHHTLERRPPDEKTEVPIGSPCGGEELIVLDGARQPVATGQVGDLWIGGVGLSPGYWEDPEKTREVFVELERPAGGRARFYRTGDLARVGPDGLVYFAGRSDTQIKSRGYRIELGEVEAALHAIPWIHEGAVIGLETQGFEGTTICCAYVTRDGKPAEAAALRASLGNLLPGYMIPGRWIQLGELPWNANGKVDRRKLSELFTQEPESVARSASTSNPPATLEGTADA